MIYSNETCHNGNVQSSQLGGGEEGKWSYLSQVFREHRAPSNAHSEDGLVWECPITPSNLKASSLTWHA